MTRLFFEAIRKFTSCVKTCEKMIISLGISFLKFAEIFLYLIVKLLCIFYGGGEFSHVHICMSTHNSEPSQKFLQSLLEEKIHT